MTRHHSKSSPFTAVAPSSRFPQGSSFSCSSLRGSGSDGCTTGTMLACWPVCSVIRQPWRRLKKRGAGLGATRYQATQTMGRIQGSHWQNPHKFKYYQNLALALSPLRVRLISALVCSKVRGALLSCSIGGCDIWINSPRLVPTDPLNPAW